MPPLKGLERKTIHFKNYLEGSNWFMCVLKILKNSENVLQYSERVFLVLQYAKLESIAMLQRSWRKECINRPPSAGKTMKSIYEKNWTTGTVEDLHRPKNLDDGSHSQWTGNAFKVIIITKKTCRQSHKRARISPCGRLSRIQQVLEQHDYCAARKALLWIAQFDEMENYWKSFISLW